jgi:threonine/homoserine/homoserine lactone efflux protein
MLEANLLLFLTASLALIFTPGPDMIYVVTRGVAQGRRAALVSAAGVCSGIAVHTALATLGLSALLARSAVAFQAVKYVGAAYLIYLGVRALMSREGVTVPRGSAPKTRLAAIFRQGVLSNVLNPKVALFFLAFLPQFVSPAAGSPALQMLLLGAVFALLGFTIFCIIAYFSGTLGDRLLSRPRLSKVLGWFTGSVFIGLGLRLALPERR